MTLEQRVEALEQEINSMKEATQNQVATLGVVDVVIEGIMTSKLFSQLV